MKIKDVEKLTGLSQRSIRLYEEKGLLEVRRDEDNQYRYYSEEDVERLKLIRVLRYFDFSIEEIKDLVTGTDESALTEALSKKADSFADKVDDFEGRSEQCRKLIKEIKRSGETEVLDDYIEMIGALDDEELKELDELAKQIEHPSIGATLLWTLIFSGPILTGLLMGVRSKLHILLIAVSSALMAIDWVMYIRGRSRRKEYQKERDKGSLWIFAVLIVCIVTLLASAVGVEMLRFRFLDMVIGKQMIFFEGKYLTESIFFVGLAIAVTFPIMALLHKLTGNDDYSFGKEFLGNVSRHKSAAAAVIIILLYAGFMGMTAVTENSIVCFDAFHPSGAEYDLNEIQSVETGFTKKGYFYYKVKLPDNKKVKFEAPSVNAADHPQYKDTGSYEELVDFDAKLMSLGVAKVSDKESIKYADYDEECMKNFKKIINE